MDRSFFSHHPYFILNQPSPKNPRSNNRTYNCVQMPKIHRLQIPAQVSIFYFLLLNFYFIIFAGKRSEI